MVERLLLHRDQAALGHHLDHGHVRAFVEELGGGEVEHAVVFDHDEETVLGPAHAVGHLEVERRREGFHLVGRAVTVAVGHGPDACLARAHEEHVGGGCHRHVTRVGHHGVEVDLEARWQLHGLEVGADRVGVLALLRNRRNVQVDA
ncbi:hypothetical protein D9M68_783960 [compost metagenome]